MCSESVPQNKRLLEKFTDITALYYKQQFTLNFEKILHDKMEPLTLDKTVVNLANSFKNIERQLKDWLPAQVQLFYSNEPNMIEVRKDGIKRKLQQIAPEGLKGVEPDYYYLIHMYLNDVKMFDLEQRKQWECYVADLDIIFDLLYLYNKFGHGFDLQYKNITKHTFYINHRFDQFKTMTTCSKTLFNNILSALNRWMPILWLSAYYIVKDYRYIAPLLPPLPPPPPAPPSPTSQEHLVNQPTDTEDVPDAQNPEGS